MTYLIGDLSVRRGHRLHKHLNHLLILTTSLGIASEWASKGLVTVSPGDNFKVRSKQFPKLITLPLYGPVHLALKEKEPDEIQICIESDEPIPSHFINRGSGHKSVFLYAISPLLVDFYEAGANWFDKINTKKESWPEVWNFGRVIRNSISHGGNIYFTNPSAPAVSWYALTYGPEQNNKKIIGTDLSFADLLFLMIEMSDELDRLGAPI